MGGHAVDGETATPITIAARTRYEDTREAPSADEAFLYESSIDRTTYEELRDKLREELTLAELELSEAQVEQFDIDSALAKAISVLNNASALWIDASLEDRLAAQEVLSRRPSVRWRRIKLAYVLVRRVS